MVECIEHLRPKLQLDTLGDGERLDKTEVNIPVARRGEDVSSRSVLTGRRDAEGLCQIDAAGKSIYGFK